MWLLQMVWFLYTALGILWTVLSIPVAATRQGYDQFIVGISTFQILLGLLFLSVNAATSLAEERVRGSLDMLLTTPLSTRTILVGKWLGTFGQTARVLVWPAIMAGLLVGESGRVDQLSLVAGTDPGVYRGDHERGTGTGDLGGPAGARRRALRIGVRRVLDRLGGAPSFSCLDRVPWAGS